MTTTTLSKVSAGLEIATGIALIVAPALVVRVLLSVPLEDAGIAVGRLGGLGLLSLGIACWPSGDITTAQADRALLIYNLLATFYLGYLRVGVGFVSYLLWPACILHAVLTILFARQMYGAKQGVA